MVRIFFTNLVRSVLFCMLAFVVAGALNIGAAYLVELIFHVGIAFWWCTVLSCLAAAGVFQLLMHWGEDTDAIVPPSHEVHGSFWLKRAARGKHVKFIAVWLTLLLHLAIGAVAVWLYFQYGEGLAKMFVDMPEQPPYLQTGIYLTAALASVGIVQIMYFFAYWGHYKKMRCEKCKNVHCLVFGGDVNVRENAEFEFRDSNETHEVEFELDGHRYSGVANKSYSRRIAVRDITFERRCVICGHVMQDTRRERRGGAWQKDD